MVQIKSESKKGIAKILRRLGVTEIKWTRLDADIGAVEHRVEVPDEGSDWLKGHPTTKELQDSAYKAITEKKPELLQPPWRQLQYDWGPDDLPSRIQVLTTCCLWGCCRCYCHCCCYRAMLLMAVFHCAKYSFLFTVLLDTSGCTSLYRTFSPIRSYVRYFLVLV